MNNKRKGDDGEDLAASYYRSLGYHIVKRNLRCRRGEVDILVYKDDALTFVEVKHWNSERTEDLSRAIDRRKRGRILACANEFIACHPEWGAARIGFDVVLITEKGLVLYRGAFTENGFE